MVSSMFFFLIIFFQKKAYAAISPPPDISGLLAVLTYYVGSLDAESTAELLRTQSDGTFLVRDGKDPNWYDFVFLVFNFLK